MSDITLPSKLLQALDTVPSAKRYFIALSGGLDSIALLHFFRLLNPNLTVQAIHIHHGLSANAEAWAGHCETVCRALNVSCHIERVRLELDGEGVEAAARKARYRVFESILQEGDILLQGHHMNDQAETVLMRALRGAGPKGLSAIPTSRSLACGAMLFRPWLSISRGTLFKEAQRHSLSWVEDESNEDTAFDRNYIRHEVLPVLERRWPDCVSELAKVAARANEAQSFLDQWCEKQFAALLKGAPESGSAISIDVLLSYSRMEQEALLRHWIERLSLPQPSLRVFERVWAELIPARPDAGPMLQWGKVILRRYGGYLFCGPMARFSEQPYHHVLEFSQVGEVYQVELPLGMFSLKLCAFDELDSTFAPESRQGYPLFIRVPDTPFSLDVRARQGGEQLRLGSQGPSKKLKNLYQENNVLPWQRSTLPAFVIEDVLVAAGYWVAADFQPKPGSNVLVCRLSVL